MVDRINASHHVMKHPSKPGRPSVPVHAGQDLGKGILNSILKEAGLK
jgi:predicted RNA binding protein YcfA (HicA-like mRNA interferase family)